MSEIAVDAGRVFISLNPAAFPTTERPRVRAISETTGRVLWTYTATGSSVLFPPAASVGAVHVVRSDALVILDAATGGVLAETPAPTEIRLEGRATPTGGLVFVPCETTSTHRNCDAIFDATSGTFLRTVERSSNWLSYNPSVLAGDLLLSLEYQRIRAFHPADGTLAWEYANPSIASLPTSLVVSKPEGFVCTTTQVVCIDTTTREATSFTLPYKSRIVAFVKGVVYSARSDNPGSASPNVLDAYDFQTGALLWSWTSTPGTFDRDVIVTDNLLFISAGGTVAVDLTTHETVWRDSIGGALALSGTGVLYVLREISSDSTSLVAYNLSALPSP
jgi:outer membrane protein assembly factor BamB